MTGYTVLKPSNLYHGRSYSGLAEDWFNWFLSSQADNRNTGSVVFLRSSGLPHYSLVSRSNSQTELSATSTFGDEPYYDKPYPNNPNVRIGGEKLRIRDNQAVFWPWITSFDVKRRPYYDWGRMQEYTGLLIDNGDDPPIVNNITINGSPINIGTINDMREFRTQTNIFTALVPESDYGTSVKDFLEEEIVPGEYAAHVDGYFVLLKFEPGTYILHSRVSAGREVGGPYVAEILYEIEVDRAADLPHRGILERQPFRNEAIIRKIVNEKLSNKEIDETRAQKIMDAVFHKNNRQEHMGKRK